MKQVSLCALYLLLVLLLASSDLHPNRLVQQCLAADNNHPASSLRRNTATTTTSSSSSSSSSHNDTNTLQSSSSTTSTCDCEQDDVASSSSLPLRLAYLIAIHNERTLHDAIHLLRAIRHPNHHILIHLDVKAQELLDNSSLLQEVHSCPCATKTLVRIESVYNVSWSHWSMNLPTLWGMQELLQIDEWDVFINLSGDTLPVYRPNKLANLLSSFRYNFVTSSSCETGLLPTNVYEFPKHWHKRVHYTHHDTEPDPVFDYTEENEKKQITMVTHFGSQWMILQRPFCQWLIQEMERPNSLPSLYSHYLQQSGKLMTDETFFATLIVHKFPETLPKLDANGFLLYSDTTNATSSSTITDVRYERMDEHVPTSSGYLPHNQRYQVPPNSSHVVEPVRPWGPYFLGVYDLGNVRTSGAFFVRKVSEFIDDNMIRLLPVEHRSDIPAIYWPQSAISLSDKPNWEQKLIELRQRAAAAAAAAAAAKEPSENSSVDEDEEL